MQQQTNPPQQTSQATTAEPPQNSQNANTGFEAQETMQGDGVAQPQPQQPSADAQPSANSPIMEEGGEVKQSDGLDWGLVFTFFNFRDE